MQRTYINSLNNNTIYHLTIFCKETQAEGVLYVIMYTRNDYIDFSKSHYYSASKERAESGLWSANLSYGTYLVLSYDIESNGRLQNGLPADSTKIDILGDFRGTL